MYFASFIQVGESMQDPAKYYQNNVVNTLNLLNAVRAYGVDKLFIFSSTAAIFGETDTFLSMKHIPSGLLILTAGGGLILFFYRAHGFFYGVHGGDVLLSHPKQCQHFSPGNHLFFL